MPGPTRRNFINKSLKGILWTGMVDVLLSTNAHACIPGSLPANKKLIDDIQKIQDLIADKKNPLKWVFTGDSITQGAKHTIGWRSYPEIFSERVRFEMNRGRDIIVNSAISGNTSQDILQDFAWRVKQFGPNVVSIMIGTNDAATSRHITVEKFQENLFSMVKGIRKIDAIPILHTPNIIIMNENGTMNERHNLPMYVAAVRKVAAEDKVILIDHWKYWEANENKVKTEKWMNDPLHPNGKGHLEMARLLFQTLSICDASSYTCTANIPF